MRIESVRSTRARLSELLRHLAEGPVVITRNGKPCAALVELDNGDDMESFLLAHNRRLLRLIDRSVRRGGRTSLDRVRAQLG